jgi:phage terminase large subunit-like protein
LTRRDARSDAAWISCADATIRAEFLDSLGEAELRALPYLFDFWALPHQLPPEGAWRTWVILGGRGAGKTRAGAEWVRGQVEGAMPLDQGRARRVALVGETYDQVRDVMVFGDSGIMACSPPDRRPQWKAGERKLVWPNGAEAVAFSAHEPEGLRGPQFDAAWVDELAKWRKGEDTWDMLQFALRLGDDPRVCVTTTPRRGGVLGRVLDAPSTVRTHAPTEANRGHLAESFLAEVRARYAGTRLGRQELDGEMLEDVDGALWTHELLEGARVAKAPDLDRIVVAVDPSVSGHATGDACGIVVAGVVTDGPPQMWRAYVLADLTVRGTGPTGWARAAVQAVRDFGADRLVAEVNQGGKLVEEVIRQVDPLVPYRAVHASRGKSARAEPVAALYEQGRVRHVGGLDGLEDQMCLMTAEGFVGQGSPDRVDALVWAMHELMIAPAARFASPRIRLL